MRVSISVQSAYNVEDPREGARRMIERARAARDAGLDALFVGDHHGTALPYYQNTAILGRMLAEWGDRPAGALYLLPLWHPLIVAEQVGTLASVMTGRFILQCAIGPADNQFEAMGVPVRQRPSRFEQSLSILRRLWAGETVTTGGQNDRFGLREARISPFPPEPVEVWIGASAPPAIDRAARLGDGWLAAPGLTPGEAGEQLALYREACERHGRSVGVCAIRAISTSARRRRKRRPRRPESSHAVTAASPARLWSSARGLASPPRSLNWGRWGTTRSSCATWSRIRRECCSRSAGSPKSANDWRNAAGTGCGSSAAAHPPGTVPAPRRARRRCSAEPSTPSGTGRP